ncbi:hypothetical protein [Acinetobacter colistiniresistens]|uniref:hypothetical protein n=1 Tax=Acinetobacter colistiniresistens TaxID=280145 RepID=UPI00051889D4|nr:hypothetical protein [Acinetobacter colistiniresistens]
MTNISNPAITSKGTKLPYLKIPEGTTNIENDGTFWKCEKHQWWHWNEHFQKWFPYVGEVNENFLNLRIQLVVEV